MFCYWPLVVQLNGEAAVQTCLFPSFDRVTQKQKWPRVAQSMLGVWKVDVLCMLAAKAQLFCFNVQYNPTQSTYVVVQASEQKVCLFENLWK